MAKLILLVCLFMFFVGCNQNPDCNSQDETIQKVESEASNTACPEPTPKPEDPSSQEPEINPIPGDVPNEALIFDVSAKLYNFSRTDEEKVYKAFEIIKKVIATNEFRDRVYQFTYQGKKQFVDNKGLTNEQIYQIVLNGKENLLPVVDHEMDLELQLYYSIRNTVGYTTPGELKIYMNTKFFYPYTPSEVAGNVFHEWIHKLGFDHSQNYSTARDSSVPYALGYLMRDLGKKYE